MARAYKCTILFNDGLAGWSETYYRQAADINDAMNSLQTLRAYRVAFLRSPCAAVFLRVSDFKVPNVALLKKVGATAPDPVLADVPWTGVLARVTSANAHRRMLCLRGVDDDLIVGGEYTGDASFEVPFQQFAQRLQADGWQLLVTGLAGNPTGVNTVDATGLCTTLAPHGLISGDTVKFLRAHLTTGNLVKGLYANITVTGSQTFTMPTWPAGAIAINGKVRKYLPEFDNIVSAQTIRAAHRIVGRPFGSPRGRRRRSA